MAEVEIIGILGVFIGVSWGWGTCATSSVELFVGRPAEACSTVAKVKVVRVVGGFVGVVFVAKGSCGCRVGEGFGPGEMGAGEAR